MCRYKHNGGAVVGPTTPPLDVWFQFMAALATSFHLVGPVLDSYEVKKSIPKYWSTLVDVAIHCCFIGDTLLWNPQHFTP